VTHLQDILDKPLKLDPKNFTPRTRTPWAGTRIATCYKSNILSAEESGQKIGESWEFSCDPDFPSRILATSVTLPEVIATDPEKALSPLIAKQAGGLCEILLKLIDADDPLSWQIHPSDTDPDLRPNECGKPESWLVLQAEEGAGLYLGLSSPMDRDTLRQKITSNQFRAEDLYFLPVKPGDYFEIEPGVAHAIGPGVVILEPQRVLFGKSGKTFRLWDWNRKYNKAGELDPQNGAPRELHIDAALKLFDPQIQTGESLLKNIKKKPQIFRLDTDNAVIESYPANAYYRLLRVHINPESSINIEIENGYAAAINTKGSCTIQNKKTHLQLSLGESAFFPFAAFPITIATLLQENSTAELNLVVPSAASIRFISNKSVQESVEIRPTKN